MGQSALLTEKQHFFHGRFVVPLIAAFSAEIEYVVSEPLFKKGALIGYNHRAVPEVY